MSNKDNQLYFVEVDGGDPFSARGIQGIKNGIQDLWGDYSSLSFAKKPTGLLFIDFNNDGYEVNLTCTPIDEERIYE